MNSNSQAGFVYTLELVNKHGVVVDREVVHNLMPIEGIDHMLNVALKGATQHGTWYIGLYQGNYTPSNADIAATLPAAATECIGYTSATRLEFVEGAVSGGSVDNSASRAEFVSTADATVYGGFITSAPAKGAISGVLLSVVRFSSPKDFSTGSTLRVTAGITIASA